MTQIEINCQFITVRVPEGHPVGQPIPLRLKVDSENPNCWSTADGKRLFVEKQWAEKSMEMDSDEYKERSQQRVKASRIARAEIVTDYTGLVTTTGDEDDYAQDVAELLEKHGDRLSWAGVSDEDIPAQLPGWAFCCTEDGFDFDLEGQLESYLEDNHHEDARDHLVDEKALWEFFNAWCEKQTLTSYMVDYKRIVVIDPAKYELELAEAKAFLDGSP